METYDKAILALKNYQAFGGNADELAEALREVLLEDASRDAGLAEMIDDAEV